MSLPNLPQHAAYTKPVAPYPCYINVTREGDVVTVALRGDARDGVIGPFAHLELTWDEWLTFFCEVQHRL